MHQLKVEVVTWGQIENVVSAYIYAVLFRLSKNTRDARHSYYPTPQHILGGVLAKVREEIIFFNLILHLPLRQVIKLGKKKKKIKPESYLLIGTLGF